MKAFHDDQKIKDKYLSRVLAHKEADEIIQGSYWENGKGCAVGCTIHGSDHSKYEMELGIPNWLARLEDKIFEGLSSNDAKSWPSDFLAAINIGADLEKIKIPYLIFVVESAREKFNHQKHPKQLASINGVLVELRKDKLDLEKLKDASHAAVACAAAYAADATAAACAADAAAYAAYAATDAAYAATDAAYAAAAASYATDYATDATDARRNEFKKFADKLLELLRECKD